MPRNQGLNWDIPRCQYSEMFSGKVSWRFGILTSKVVRISSLKKGQVTEHMPVFYIFFDRRYPLKECWPLKCNPIFLLSWRSFITYWCVYHRGGHTSKTCVTFLSKTKALNEHVGKITNKNKKFPYKCMAARLLRAGLISLFNTIR